MILSYYYQSFFRAVCSMYSRNILNVSRRISPFKKNTHSVIRHILRFRSLSDSDSLTDSFLPNFLLFVLFDFLKKYQAKAYWWLHTTQKVKFQLRIFFRLRIWSHLRKKSLMENLILCAVPDIYRTKQWFYWEAFHASILVQNWTASLNI